MSTRSLCTLLASLCCTWLSAAPEKPNIVFILADDYGTGEVGCYGADNYKTPHIDALAAKGIRFTNFYTAALCGPSRALILTGRYAFRTGATNQDATGRFTPAAEKMMPSMLKPAGYVTSMVGKWGQLPAGPKAFGFDDWLTFKGSGVYWSNSKGEKGISYELNEKALKLKDDEYMPDLMHAHAVKFIRENKDKPFYLYYSLSGVHGDIVRTPDSKPDSKDLYQDNVAYMDKLVGKITAELERLNLREKTLIVFMGDNGTANGHSKDAKISGRVVDGAKGSMQEGGGLVPFIVSWPGVTAPGKTYSGMTDASDLVPTFTEIAGGKLPENKKLDGKSFVAQLQGAATPARPWAYNQLAAKWYVRETGWKMTETGALYDMSEAPFAEKLVPPDSTNPAAVAARTRLTAALAELNPAGGIKDDGDGTGRHAENKKAKAAKKAAK